jgi:hypothetical protein
VKYHIPCLHTTPDGLDLREQVPDYYPLTRLQVIDLLMKAHEHPEDASSIQVRLGQGVRGVKCPHDIDGPIARVSTAVDRIFVEEHMRKRNPKAVELLCSLLCPEEQ